MLRGNARPRLDRRSVRRAAAIALVLAVTSGLAGCVAAVPEPTAAPGATSQPVASPNATPQEVCAQLIDINTLVYNEQMAFDGGRIADVEHQAVNRLAGRMVHRIDVTDSADLASAVDVLREVAGPYAPGSMTPFDPTAERWTDAFSDAQDECTRAGVEFYVEGWTGG